MKSILLLIISTAAWPQVDELYIIAGYANQTRYPYISREMYEAFQSNPGLSSSVMATPYVKMESIENDDGTVSEVPVEDWDHTSRSRKRISQEEMNALWNFIPTLTTLSSSEQVAESFNSSKPTSENREPFIFINDHGGAPRGADDQKLSRDTDTGIAVVSNARTDERMSGTISMRSYGQSFDMEQFRDMIKDNFDHNDTVRVMGIQCFSGGLHDIAFREDNMCVSASTDWLTVTTSYSDRNKFAEGAINEQSATAENKKFDFNSDGKTSLLEAHLAALAHDNLNFGRGQLSSMAYVDMVLAEGAYAPVVAPEYYNPEDNPVLLMFPEITECTTCAASFFEDFVSTSRNKLAALGEELRNGLYVPQFHDLTTQEINALPADLRPIYNQLINSNILENLNDSVRGRVQDLRTRYQEVELEINGINTILSSSILPVPVRINYEEQIIEKQEKLRDIRDDIENKITPLRGLTNYLLHLKKFSRFMDKASFKQREKYLQLLHCEMGNL